MSFELARVKPIKLAYNWCWPDGCLKFTASTLTGRQGPLLRRTRRFFSSSGWDIHRDDQAEWAWVALTSFLLLRSCIRCVGASTYTMSSTAVHRRTLARSLSTLPTLQVAEDFALPAATAPSSLQFTVPLTTAEHFRLLDLTCGTACHRRLRQRRLWQPSALDSRRFRTLSHILTFSSSDMFVSTYSIVDLAVFLKYLGHSKKSWLINWLIYDD